MNAIFTRKSVRSFSDADVSPELIQKLLKAAMQAPSACNQQPWEFYVVRNRSILTELAECSPYAACTRNAPVAVVLCSRKDTQHEIYLPLDMSAATENLLLEAEALGLGAVWLGIAPEEDRMARVSRCLELPASLAAFAIVPVGYPLKRGAPQNRYDENRVHFIE